MTEIDFSKWTRDSSCQKIMNRDYKKYIRQFDESQTEIINGLMNNMEFYDSIECNKLFENYKKYLLELMKREKNAYIFAPIDDDETHNSFRMLYELKDIGDRYKKRVHIRYLTKENGDYIFKNADTIIVVDDYCGSGNTIIKMISRINDELDENKKVIIAPMFITHGAVNNLHNCCKDFTNITYSIMCPNKIRKAKYLSDNSILNEKELELYEEISLDNELKFAHGYNKTEELLAFSYYTPNNTLGILWENSTFRIPFLGRNGNKFLDCTEKKYFSNDDICALKRCINYSASVEKRKQSAFAMLTLLGYPDDQIYTNLRFKNDDEYETFKKRVFKIGFLKKKKTGEIKKGWLFHKYISERKYTKLVYLADEQTRFKKSDEKFSEAVKLDS